MEKVITENYVMVTNIESHLMKTDFIMFKYVFQLHGIRMDGELISQL